MLKKKSIVVIAVLLIALFVVGCSNDIQDELDDGESEALEELIVDIILPEALFADYSVNVIEDNLRVDKVEISLYEGEDATGEAIKEDVKTGDEIEEELKLVFGELKSGNRYTVEVELLGSIAGSQEERVLYEGVASSDVIEEDAITSLELGVEPLPANSLELDIKSGNDIEEIILIHPGSGQEITRDYEELILFQNGQDGLELWASNWILRIVIEGDEKDLDEDILLLPTQEKKLDLRIDYDEQTGEIDIDINIRTSPDKPSNLRLSERNELLWDDVEEATVYSIYQNSENNLEGRSYKEI